MYKLYYLLLFLLFSISSCNLHIPLKNADWIIKPSKKNILYMGNKSYMISDRKNIKNNKNNKRIVIDRKKKKHSYEPFRIVNSFPNDIYSLKDSINLLALYSPPDILTKFEYKWISAIDSGYTGLYDLYNEQLNRHYIYDIESKKLINTEYLKSYSIVKNDRKRENIYFVVTNIYNKIGLMNIKGEIVFPVTYKNITYINKDLYILENDSLAQFVKLDNSVIFPWAKLERVMFGPQNEVLFKHGNNFLLINFKEDTFNIVDSSMISILKTKNLEKINKYPPSPDYKPIIIKVLEKSNLDTKNFNISRVDKDSLVWIQYQCPDYRKRFGLINCKSESLLLAPEYDTESSNSTFPLFGITKNDSSFLFTEDNKRMFLSKGKIFIDHSHMWYNSKYFIYFTESRSNNCKAFDLKKQKEVTFNEEGCEFIILLDDERLLYVNKNEIVVYDEKKPPHYYHDINKIEYWDSTHIIALKNDGTFSLFNKNFKYVNIVKYNSFRRFQKNKEIVLGKFDGENTKFYYYKENGELKYELPYSLKESLSFNKDIYIASDYNKKIGIYDFKNKKILLPFIFNSIYEYSDFHFNVNYNEYFGILRLKY